MPLITVTQHEFKDGSGQCPHCGGYPPAMGEVSTCTPRKVEAPPRAVPERFDVRPWEIGELARAIKAREEAEAGSSPEIPLYYGF